MAQKRKTSSDIREQINRIYEENELAGLLQSKSRARSITAGTAFGGTIEVSMRGDYSSLHVLMQPVEVVEFIEQLAAASGLQIALRPKHDFASWRGWNAEVEDRYWVGSASWNQRQISESNNQSLLGPSSDWKEEEDKFNSEDDSEDESNVKKRQRKRNQKTQKYYRERSKEELEIQEEIRKDIITPVKSNIQKIREQSLKHLETLREEVEKDIEEKLEDSKKNHEEFVDEVLL